MARVLLVEDDRDQRELRRILLQRFGHEVDGCTMPLEAEAACATQTPDVVVMDLRLPTADDGRALVRALRARHPKLPIIVCTGWAEDLEGTAEAAKVQAVMRKPIKSEELVKLIAQFAVRAVALLLVLAGALQAEVLRHPFELTAAGEAAATVTLSAPNGDWGVQGKEASVAAIRVDDGPVQHVIVANGAQPVDYRLFLGALPAGRHTLTVDRDAVHSSPGVELKAGAASVRALDPRAESDLAALHAPVLFARANTIGKFSDIPLLAYYLTGVEGGQRWFEYTVVFSNEDGGTSTRNLMARWGRASDIEYVYRVWLDAAGAPARTLIQTRGHKDAGYEGPREGFHPLLVPVTNNNMVDPAAAQLQTPLRFQFAPVQADLSSGSRETVMDRAPYSYRIVADELRRENKLRPPLTVDGEKIADPANYLVVEFKSSVRQAALQVLVRRKGERNWHASSAGVPENFVERSGWARAAVELPPATAPGQIEEVAFQCMLWRDMRRQPGINSGACHLERIGQIFLPGANAAPGARVTLAPLPGQGWRMTTGEIRTLPRQ